MSELANLKAKLKKWQESCGHLTVCRSEAIAAIANDCTTAAERIERMEDALESACALLDAVYGYYYAQYPGMRDSCERVILEKLDPVTRKCSSALGRTDE